MDEALRQKIDGIVGSSPVVLFMKGTKTFPQCGFSATVVEVLKRLDADFKDVNILAEPVLRQAMKEYTNWQFFPQLYVGGKFIGGADIVRDMFEKGELGPIVDTALGRAK